MKKPPILFTLVLLGTLILPVQLSAQLIENERLLSFEDKQLPVYISGTGSTLAISTDHYKDGQSSLQWSFEPGGTLSIKKDLHFEKKDPTGKDLYLSTFIVWVYNETPANETIQFNFLKNGKPCASFPFGINFKGWRAAWVCYERDMEGTPEEGMDEIRIVAPKSNGTLFIDHLLTAAKTDHRHQTADLQVPFVNKENTNHWLVVYKHSLLKPTIPLAPINEKQKKDIALIEKRFHELIYTPGKLTDKTMADLRRNYQHYQIKYTDGKVSGLPIFFTRAAEAYERLTPNWRGIIDRAGAEVKAYFDLMYKIAVAYHNASNTETKDELKQMFLSMYDHITDQGVAYGSCWGNFTHYGYSFRNIYTSYFLMKQVLLEEGKLTDAERAMQWYAITNEVYEKPTVTGIDMDSFNTQTTGRIASILMMEDTPEKLQYLRSFARWIDNGCLPALGLSGAFKKDGGAFHHRNHYPAYAVGGLDGATNMIYLLNHTEFAVSGLGHQTVKNVLLTMRFYCNTRNFPLALSGRHPDGKGKLIPIQYALMAVSGTPDGKKDIDPEMAGAYLRLMKGTSNATQSDPEYMPQVANQREEQMIRLLTGGGYTPEADPQGNIAMGYGCVSVQRRSNWSAVVRGHSRYLWAAEHYIGANFYGRYLAHGSMQILTAPVGKEVTPLTSGWQENGFDWGRMPGTTAIHLPIPELRAKVLNVDSYSGIEEMLYSDEAFAGGLTQLHNNGNFGMKLHEHDKYNGTHRARKSFHFLGNMIVCLGSDIENRNDQYSTETTVFQLTVADEQAKDYWNNYQAQGKVWMDHLHTGYYVPVRATLEKNFPQYSLGQNTGKETQGDWVSLVIDHGKAPEKAAYEYAVFPQTEAEQLNAFARKPTYKVLQHDRKAHIVHSDKEGITSYVLFETPDKLPKGLLLKADTSCLVMIREHQEQVTLTVCQPDLALYRGPSDELFDENGKRVERSIYSRPWIGDESGEIPVTVTLKGEWNIPETSNCRVVSAGKKQTVIEVVCKDGASYDIELN
ncbi:chondroitinase [Bacteroides sp. 51]|nr:chondroitinase family polysaccharide lyase [Bacteroides sp. 51]NDV82527.1 chondroitinase [Bacteroides sp. 51]